MRVKTSLSRAIAQRREIDRLFGLVTGACDDDRRVSRPRSRAAGDEVHVAHRFRAEARD